LGCVAFTSRRGRSSNREDRYCGRNKNHEESWSLRIRDEKACGASGRRKARQRGNRGGDRCKTRWQNSTARIYAPRRVRDSNLTLMPTCFAKLLESIFCYFAKIRWMSSCFCQTVGVALRLHHIFKRFFQGTLGCDEKLTG
jgi:hypothetical protein